MTRWVLVTICAIVWPATGALAQTCQTVRVQEQRYQSIADKIYVYVGEIASTGPGRYSPFRVRVLAGSYRPPFLLPNAYMRESDLDALLGSRGDIVQTPVAVPNPPSAQPVQVGGVSGKFTVAVQQVAAGQGNADAVVLMVCR